MSTPTRYFTDDHSIWKFPADGVPQIRGVNDSEWYDSVCTIADMESTEWEITEEKGEP